MWSAFAQLLLRMSNFLVVIVVARLISPHELGVYAVAWVFYSVIGLFMIEGVVRV